MKLSHETGENTLLKRARCVIKRFERGDPVVRDGGITRERYQAMVNLLAMDDLPAGMYEVLDRWVTEAVSPYRGSA